MTDMDIIAPNQCIVSKKTMINKNKTIILCVITIYAIL